MILCPKCNGDLCPLCAMNKLCQNCYEPLDQATIDLIDEELAEEYLNDGEA